MHVRDVTNQNCIMQIREVQTVINISNARRIQVRRNTLKRHIYSKRKLAKYRVTNRTENLDVGRAPIEK